MLVPYSVSSYIRGMTIYMLALIAAQRMRGRMCCAVSSVGPLTLVMTSAQVVETSVNVTSKSPCQDYTHPDDHNLPNYDMTPGFKPFGVGQVIIFCRVLTATEPMARFTK